MALNAPLTAECADRPPLQRTAAHHLFPSVYNEPLLVHLAHDVELIQHDGIKKHPRELDELITGARPVMWKRVFNIVHNEADSDDLTQEASIRVADRINTLRDPMHFLGWAGTVAARTALGWTRHKQMHLQTLTSKVDGGEIEVAEPYPARSLEALLHEQRVELIDRVLSQLPAPDKELLVRFYIEDVSIKTLIQELNVPEGTVKRRLHTARSRFADCYETLSNPQLELLPDDRPRAVRLGHRSR